MASPSRRAKTDIICNHELAPSRYKKASLCLGQRTGQPFRHPSIHPYSLSAHDPRSSFTLLHFPDPKPLSFPQQTTQPVYKRPKKKKKNISFIPHTTYHIPTVSHFNHKRHDYASPPTLDMFTPEIPQSQPTLQTYLVPASSPRIRDQKGEKERKYTPTNKTRAQNTQSKAQKQGQGAKRSQCSRQKSHPPYCTTVAASSGGPGST